MKRILAFAVVLCTAIQPAAKGAIPNPEHNVEATQQKKDGFFKRNRGIITYIICCYIITGSALWTHHSRAESLQYKIKELKKFKQELENQKQRAKQEIQPQIDFNCLYTMVATLSQREVGEKSKEGLDPINKRIDRIENKIEDMEETLKAIKGDNNMFVFTFYAAPLTCLPTLGITIAEAFN